MMRPNPRRRWLQHLGGVALLMATRPGHAGAAPRWPELKARIRSRYPAVPQLSVSALRDWLRDSARPPPLLLDIRTPEEFADGHLIPTGENLARFIAERVQAALAHSTALVIRVCLAEDATLSSTYELDA